LDATFKLTERFLSHYKDVKPNFGFGGVGELVYTRTYSRVKENGQNEVWWETCRRVVEGCYRMQERHIKAHNLGWDARRAQRSAQEMYDRMFTFKFLPPGRGIWAMGTELTESRGMYAALNNCGFVSTEHIAEEGSKAFRFLMDASMLGIGVGFDVRGADKMSVPGPSGVGYVHVISDDREGWVESVGLLIDCYFYGRPVPMFSYELIRPAGAPIGGFGGVASGPEPLIQLHSMIHRVLGACTGKLLPITAIVDLMNLIGKCVVAGNVRRTAEIVFGEPDSAEYLNLKSHWWNDQKEEVVHPELGTVEYKGGWDGPAAYRADWSWTSNNSVFCTPGMDYARCATQTALNGEPGYCYLDNMRAYGRIIDGENWRDHRVAGGNPCLEQSLESMELCCLVETYPNNHETLEDFRKTLKYAYLYAKTVTLGATHWPETNRVMLRNRRIGTSMSGIQQFIASRGIHEFKSWCEQGFDAIHRYDRIYSDWFAVPVSIKTTSVKPSGTVSLLAGATPGMHWPESLHYIRRITLAKNSDLVQPLLDAGYPIEDKVGDSSSVIVSCPVKIDDLGGKLRTVSQVSLWEQVAMASFLQTYWADNQVSCTVTFDPSEGPQIEHALNYFQYSLKGISFLPKCEQGSYPQMPYEEISPYQYEAMRLLLKPLNLGTIRGEEAEVEKFCSNAGCAI
jgi:ribonucleoside-triphosphate reductase